MSSINGTPQHYPMDLSRYGQNPYGENLYRLVFAPSIRHTVGGTWADGAIEYRSRPTYRQLGNEWVLERWLSPQEYYGMTKDAYEKNKVMQNGMYAGGPWSERGMYFMCMDAAIRVEAIPSISKLIEGIEFGRNNRSHEREMLNRQLADIELAKQEKAEDDKMLDRIKELRPAFGNRPTSFAGGVHSTKSSVTLIGQSPFKMSPGSLKVIKEKANA